VISQTLSIVAPIFFTLVLGYWAGRAKRFDSDQVAGINELVLDYAVPAALFAGAVRTSRAALLEQTPLFVSLLISIVGTYAIAFAVGRLVFRHDLAAAALQSISVAFAAGVFIGPAVLRGIYGPSSAVGIAMIAIVLNAIVVPATLVLLNISRSGPTDKAGDSLFVTALINALKAPMVSAPLIAIALVLAGVSVSPIVTSTLGLIGAASSGAALFVAGAAIAAHKIRLNAEIFTNIALKMLAQPALYFALAMIFRVIQPYANEGFLLTLLPSGFISLQLAVRYKTYVSEAGSTLALSTLALVVTLPIGIYLIGAR
jgi:malonate transporter and related proteins